MLTHVRLFCKPMDYSPSGYPVNVSFQECRSELPFPTPRDLPNPGIKPSSLVSPGVAGGSLTIAPPGSLASVQKHSQLLHVYPVSFSLTILIH